MNALLKLSFMVVLSIVAVACATCGCKEDLSQSANSELGIFAAEQKQDSHVHGTIILEKESLDKAGVTYEEALKFIAEDNAASSTKMFVSGGDDSAVPAKSIVRARSDKYKVDLGGVGFVISKDCLKKNNIKAEDALKRIAAGTFPCATTVVVSSGGTDDYDSHAIKSTVPR